MKALSLIVLWLAGSLFSLHSLAQKDLRRQPIGTTVSGQFKAGPSHVLLPEGMWTLIGSSETTTWPPNSGRGIRWTQLWLAQTEGQHLRALVRVSGSIDTWPLGNWTGTSPCDRTDILLATTRPRSGQDSTCLAINHYVGYLPGKGDDSSYNRQAYLWLENNGVTRPGTMIVVSFHRHFIPGNALNVYYYFNPESEGFPPSSKPGWANNDWNKKFVERDDKKLEYVRALKSWVFAMKPLLEQGYKGDTGPSAQLPWPTRKAGMQAAVDNEPGSK